MKQHLPEEHERIRQLEKEDPRRARGKLWRLYFLYIRVRDYPEQARDAAIGQYKVTRSIVQALREYRRTEDEAEKKSLTKRMGELLAEQFDFDQTLKEHEVSLLAKRVTELAEEIRRRRADRGKVIAEKLERLLRQPAAAAPASRPARIPRTRPARRPGEETATGPRPRRRGPSLRPRGQRERLSPEKIEEILNFTRQHMPELHKRLEALRKDNPRHAMRVLHQIGRVVRYVRSMPPKVRDAAIGVRRLNVAIRAAVSKLRSSADADEKKALMQSLRELLGKQFESEQVVKEYQAKRLARHLEELKAEIARRKGDRAKIIAERLKRLTSTGALRRRPGPEPGRPGRGPGQRGKPGPPRPKTPDP